MRKVIFCLLAWVALLYFPSMLMAGNSLPIAFDDYPPYHYWDKGVPRGLNVEILDKAFSRMGVKARYVHRTWQRSMYELKSGEIAGLCAGIKTKEREQFAVYPSRHLSLDTNWVMALAGTDVRPSDLEDLRGLSIGVVSGYAYGKEFDRLGGLNKHPSKTDTLLLKKLLNNRLDVIVGNSRVFKFYAAKTGEADRLDYRFRVASDPLYLIFSKQWPGADDLAARLSNALKAMERDGTTAAIKARY